MYSWLLFITRIKQTNKFHLKIPKNTNNIQTISVPSQHNSNIITQKNNNSTHTTEPKKQSSIALNLTIDTKYNQHYIFYSIKSFIKPKNNNINKLTHIHQLIQTTHLQNIQHLKLNNIDPITYSQILNITKKTQNLKYSQMTIYTTNHHFTNQNFTQKFLNTKPHKTHIIIPLYNINPKIHNTITRTPGSHINIMCTIKTLLNINNPEQLTISTMIIKQNINKITQITTFTKNQKITLETHLPYPIQQNIHNPYQKSTLHKSNIIKQILSTTTHHTPNQQYKLIKLLTSLIPHPYIL